MTITRQNLCSHINNEWRNRPRDERFLSLDELHHYCLERSKRCYSESTPMRRLAVSALEMGSEPLATSPPIGPDNDLADKRYHIVFQTDAGHIVDSTHWAFTQLAAAINTPAQYLRRVDPRIAVDLIDYGITFLSGRDEHQMFIESEATGRMGKMRAFTSPSYGRIYDHDVVEMVRDAADPDVWRPPCHDYSGPVGTTNSTTMYASDRDVSIFLVDDRNPIEISVEGRHESLCRGFYVRNSEVGRTTLKVDMFWYRYTCDNRLLWTPRSIQSLSIRHNSGAPERFRREMEPALERFATADPSEMRDRVEAAMRLEVGRDKQTVTEWMRARKFGPKEAEHVYNRALEEEGHERMTVWDIVQGGTAVARAIPHTDSRMKKEARFSYLLNAV